MRTVLPSAFLLISLVSPAAAQFPEAEISNRVVRAKFYLPDPEKGYYRGTRFDWSGSIHSLKYAGHEYFGVWFEKYDPKLHDAITGPVEEYRSNDAGLGYDLAKTGETFVRIGAGVVRKPEEKRYQAFRTYDIVDPGRWRIKTKRDRIEFTHELNGPNGYRYVYTKVVRLVGDKPQMEIDHKLRNTGTRAIETAQYNHNFFVIDGRPTGPEFTVKFPFDAKADRDLKGMAEVKSGALTYARELRPRGESVFTGITGFGKTASDYDFRIENSKAGAGVRIRGDRPLSKIVYWSIRTTLCPEPYIDLKVEPGREIRWKFTYDFYTLEK